MERRSSGEHLRGEAGVEAADGSGPGAAAVGAPDGRAGAPAPLQPAAAAGRATSPLVRVFPALGASDFRLLWLGMLPATLAWQMSVVASGYAALVLSGSATWLGLVSSATGWPLLLLSLVGGVVADRVPRRTVLLASQSVLALGAASIAGLSLLGALQVWHLVVLGLSQGAAFAFQVPARQAFIAQLVGGRLLRNAVALNNAGMNFARIAGPALAGGLLAAPGVGVGGVFAAMAGLFVAVILTLLRLPNRPVPVAGGKPGGGVGGWDQMLEGLRYIRSSPALRALLGLAVVTLFLGLPYQQLMPLFSEQVFQVGAAGLGLLMAANGVGALAGSLAMAALASVRRQGALQLGLGIGLGLGLVAFALAPWYPLAVGLVGLVGFAFAAYTSSNNTLVMVNAEPRLHGRVMSVYVMTFAVTPLGALPLAALADLVGARTAIAAAGAVVALTATGVALLYPPYRQIR